MGKIHPGEDPPRRRVRVTVPAGDPACEGNGNPLQHSCLGNPMDTGARQVTVHVVAKSRTLKQLSMHTDKVLFWVSFKDAPRCFSISPPLWSVPERL